MGLNGLGWFLYVFDRFVWFCVCFVCFGWFGVSLGEFVCFGCFSVVSDGFRWCKGIGIVRAIKKHPLDDESYDYVPHWASEGDPCFPELIPLMT